MDNTAQALNEVQLKKLKDEYDVKPYIVAQFPGEALFIPAGSLRQVSDFHGKYLLFLEKTRYVKKCFIFYFSRLSIYSAQSH